ncbi:MAG: 30S ribosomal protein S16 [Acidobacteria bacterium]|nr:30S ribosomal protein S16 [Acidobacteriota bacterium]
MLAIRLTRLGAKKRPVYRVVVTERAGARDGKFVEILGHYDPTTEPATVQIDRDRAEFWMARGAQPSETVRSLLKKTK